MLRSFTSAAAAPVTTRHYHNNDYLYVMYDYEYDDYGDYHDYYAAVAAVAVAIAVAAAVAVAIAIASAATAATASAAGGWHQPSTHCISICPLPRSPSACLA